MDVDGKVDKDNYMRVVGGTGCSNFDNYKGIHN